MEAKYSKIDEDIKNLSFERAYLLYGEESYLLRQYKNKLMSALIDEGDTMNLSIYDGAGISESELIDLAETMPMFAERRVILVSDSGFFEKGAADLSAYIKEMQGDTVFVFCEESVKKTSSMYKAVKVGGACVDFSTPDESVLKRWITGRLKSSGKRMEGRTLQRFIEMCAGSMEMLSTETEKLIAYCADSELITDEDLDSVGTVQTQNHIFEMIDAMTSGDKNRAAGLYMDLLDLKEPMMRILFLISREYSMLYKIKLMQGRAMSVGEMAGKLGIRDFMVRKRLGTVSRSEVGDLRERLELGVELEQKVKTGLMGEQLAVEMLLFAA